MRRLYARPCSPHVGAWLSLVEHSVRDRGVGGSNPLAPTNSAIRSTPSVDFRESICTTTEWSETAHSCNLVQMSCQNGAVPTCPDCEKELTFLCTWTFRGLWGYEEVRTYECST